MADINWPTALRAPSEMTFGLRTASLNFASPLTGAAQSVTVPGSRWLCTLQWASMVRADADVLQALLVQLRGRSNRLVVWPLPRPAPRGVGGGTPVVYLGGQTGSSINVDGLTPSTTGIYLPGDFLGIGGELKMVTAQVDSDGFGNGTINFEPPLRASPADDSAIVTNQPTAKFMLQNDDVTWRHRNPVTVDSFEMQLVEAF